MADTEPTAASATWWGPANVAEDGGLRAAIGPLAMLLLRRADEWRFLCVEEPEASEQRLSLEPCPGDATLDDVCRDPGDAVRVVRIGADTRADPLELRARTADLPVVSVPADPFVLPPDTEVVFYVSTPLRLALACRDEIVFETPLSAPRRTWVGAPTGPGGPAYANRTQCRQSLDELPARPHRAITPVAVANRGAKARQVDRLVLSLPYLALYATEGARLWTERIEIELTDEAAESRVIPGVPIEAGEAARIAEPREATPSGGLGRMIAAVF